MTHEQDSELLLLYAHVKRLEARMEMYALKARCSKKTDQETLFNSLACSFRAQARRLLLQTRGFVAASDDNLNIFIEHELPFLLEQYDRLKQSATSTSRKALMTEADHGLRVGRINRQLSAGNNRKEAAKTYYVCGFCGYIAREKMPSPCPVCTAASQRFIQVSQ